MVVCISIKLCNIIPNWYGCHGNIMLVTSKMALGNQSPLGCIGVPSAMVLCTTHHYGCHDNLAVSQMELHVQAHNYVITKHGSALYIGMAKVLPIIDVLGYDGQNSSFLLLLLLLLVQIRHP